MAVTEGVGHSRILHRRRWEDYRSLKQYHQNSRIDEVIIEGSTTTDGAATEISFVTGDIMIYTTESQVYCRCEADDANQHGKYVYLEYQDDTGAIQDIVTADLNAADSTTEVIFTGADDFYRVRQMYSEVESASGGGKMIILTDDDYAAGEEWAFISDGQSHFALQRFFTQPAATCTSYLGKVKVTGPLQDADGAAAAGYILTVTYTPKVLDLGEPQVAADITQTFNFDQMVDWQPCIELEPATEVIFKVGDIDTAATLHIEAIMLEVYV